MFPEFIITILIALATLCDTNKGEIKKSKLELLTQKEWVLISYGYDKDGNGLIDPAEEEIRDCERDNSYVFKNDGTGTCYDNFISCGNGISDFQFSWKFGNDQSTLVFSSHTGSITRLNENQLIICDNEKPARKFITVFKH